MQVREEYAKEKNYAMDRISGNFCCDNYGQGMEDLFSLLSHVQVLKTTRFILDKAHWEHENNYLNIRPGSCIIDSLLNNKFSHNFQHEFKNCM